MSGLGAVQDGKTWWYAVHLDTTEEGEPWPKDQVKWVRRSSKYGTLKDESAKALRAHAKKKLARAVLRPEFITVGIQCAVDAKTYDPTFRARSDALTWDKVAEEYKVVAHGATSVVAAAAPGDTAAACVYNEQYRKGAFGSSEVVDTTMRSVSTDTLYIYGAVASPVVAAGDVVKYQNANKNCHVNSYLNLGGPLLSASQLRWCHSAREHLAMVTNVEALSLRVNEENYNLRVGKMQTHRGIPPPGSRWLVVPPKHPSHVDGMRRDDKGTVFYYPSDPSDGTHVEIGSGPLLQELMNLGTYRYYPLFKTARQVTRKKKKKNRKRSRGASAAPVKNTRFRMTSHVATSGC